MGLETVTYISDFVVTNPVGATDQVSQLDDHIRNIKTGIKNTFPSLTGAVTATQAELNIMDGVTASTAEINILVGLTSTSTELNKLDGFTGVVGDLNILSGAAAGGLTAAELLYVKSVTSDIQTQMDTKAPLASPVFTGAPTLSGSGQTGYFYIDANGFGFFTAAAAGGEGVYFNNVANVAQINVGGSQILLFDATHIYPDLTNTIAIGASGTRFSNVFSVLLNVSGTATITTLSASNAHLDTDSNVAWADAGGISQGFLHSADAATAMSSTTYANATVISSAGNALIAVFIPPTATTMTYEVYAIAVTNNGIYRMNTDTNNGTDADVTAGTKWSVSGTLVVSDKSGWTDITVQWKVAAGGSTQLLAIRWKFTA